MSKKITIEISDEDYNSLVAAFSAESSKKETSENFIKFAFTNAYNWITGAKRYRTMTEQYIDWVEIIYTDVLPIKEKPSYDRLYNSFNMTPGQAAYIARVLQEKKLSHWRKLALEDLLTELKKHEETATKLKEKGDQDVSINITIDELSSVELKRISEQIWQDDKSFLPPKPAHRFASIIDYEVPFESLLEIIKYLEK